MEDLSSTSALAATSDALPIDRSRRYLLSGRVRAEQAGQAVVFTLAQLDGSGAHIPNANRDFLEVTDTEWRSFHGLIEGLDARAAAVRVMLWPVPWTADGDNTGAACFDDVRLVPHDGNLVANGDFEQDGGWSGGSVAAGEGRRGTRALEIDDPGAGDVAASSTALVPVLPGEPYLVEAWVRGEREQQSWVTLEQLDEDGGWLPGRNLDLVVSADAGWTRLARWVRTDPRAGAVRLVLRPAPWTSDGGFAGRAWFDDVGLHRYGGDLLQNGGFEAGTVGWSGGTVDGGRPHGGSAALLVEDGSQGASVGVISGPLVPVAPGAVYAFEAWVRAPAGGQEVWLAVNQFDADGNWIPGHNRDHIVTAGTEWSLFRTQLAPLHPLAVGIRVTLYPVRWTEDGERTGHAWFDDVAVRLHEGNLLPNGGFDLGTDGWQGGVLDAGVSRTGPFSLRVEDTRADVNVGASSGLLPLAPGFPYAFSAWLRSDRDQTVLLSLNQHDAQGSWISGANLDFTVAATDEWTCFQRVIHRFHPRAAFVRVVLYAVEWSDSGDLTGRAWFDDVRFGPEGQIMAGAWLRRAGPVRAWWSPPEQKVRRHYELAPGAPDAGAVPVAAARGESEPFQVVLAPDHDDRIVAVAADDFAGPGGAAIPSARVTLREVAYVDIETPTDPGGFVCCEMPDPLPALTLPLDLRAGRQQPLWVTVAVPADAPAGAYTGRLVLDFESAEDVTIPVDLRVWDFELPRERHIRTAYGLSLGLLDRYHNLSRNHPLDPAAARAARREVLRLYLEDFAAHRVSSGDPFGDDLFTVGFPSWNWTDADLVPDALNPGNTVAEVRDDDGANCVAISGSESFPVDRRLAYRLEWRARTDTARRYLVSVNQYRADGQWISGANLDFAEDGSTAWAAEGRDVPAALFHADAAAVRVHLYPLEWPQCGAGTGTAWFDDLDFHPAGGANLVPNPGFDVLRPEDVTVRADFGDFDAAATLALDTQGADSFLLPLPYFPTGNGTTETFDAPAILDFAWGTPEYEQVFGRMLRTIDDHLAARGWLGRAYAYWWDEPQPRHLDVVRTGMDLLGRADPRLPRLLTFNLPVHEQMEGHVDIWTPQVDQYRDDWASEQRRQGRQTWWYVSSGNRAPWPNNFIDYPALDVRLQFWAAWRSGAQGSLYWLVNYWSPAAECAPADCPDPWRDPQSPTGDGGLFGNGDGRLLYPPREFADGRERREGPVPSLRWELIRDGIEDYEYFWSLDAASQTLRQRVGDTALVRRARALLVPDGVVRSSSSRTSNPLDLAAHRRAVAETLLEVLRALRPPED